MNADVKVIHHEWRGVLVRASVDHAAEEGNRRWAEAVLEDAQKHVPYDIGNLAESGAVTQGRDSGGRFVTEHFVSYDTPYAVRLHEHPEYNFKGQGEGKWLEHAMQRHGGSVREIAPPFVRLFAL